MLDVTTGMYTTCQNEDFALGKAQILVWLKRTVIQTIENLVDRSS